MSGGWRPAACAACGGPLTPHERATGGHCAAPACAEAKMRAGVAQAERARAVRRDAALDRAMASVARARDAALAALGVAGAEAAVAATPHMGRPVAPADPAAQARFLAAFDALLAEAFAAQPAPPGGDEAARLAGEAPEAVEMAACCRTCRGFCCTQGAAAHAFLTVGDIARQRRRTPGVTAAALRARYADAMAREAVEGSCVYHGAGGCVLPRDMRADVCNDHRCRSQDAVAAALRPGMKALVLVSCDGDAPRRVAVVGRACGSYHALGEVDAAGG